MVYFFAIICYNIFKFHTSLEQYIVKINITAGEYLNKILENKYENEKFIPFCEAMLQGSYNATLFSEKFIEQRAETHNVSAKFYKEKLHEFLEFLKNIKQYSLVVLWFGNEPFCNENKKIVLQTLKEYDYRGIVILNTVIEETGEVIKTENFSYL